MNFYDKIAIMQFLYNEAGRLKDIFNSEIKTGSDNSVDVRKNIYGFTDDVVDQIRATYPKDVKSNFDKLQLDLRVRLDYTVMLAELAIDPKISIDDLADFSSPKGLARKAEAGKKVRELLVADKTEEFKKFLTDGNLVFRDKVEEFKNNTKTNDDEEFIKNVYGRSMIFSAHMDGSQEHTNIGVDKDEAEKNVGLSYVYNAVAGACSEFSKTDTQLHGADSSDAKDRTIAASLIRNIALTQYFKNMVNTGEYKNVKGSVDVLGKMAPYSLNVQNFLAAGVKGKENGICGALSGEELCKLVMTPSTRKDLIVDYMPDDEGNANLKITFRGMVLLDTKNKVAPDPTQLAEVKTIIEKEFVELRDKEFSSKYGLDCFKDKENIYSMLDACRIAGEDYAKELKANTKFGRSSDNYRDMQKEIEKFNRRYANVNVRKDKDGNEIKNPFYNEHLRLHMKQELNTLVNSIKRYIDGKNGFTKTEFKNDYEATRVRAAMNAYDKFTKLQKTFELAEKFEQRSAELETDKQKVEKKFSVAAKNTENINGMNALVDQAKTSALKLCEIANNREVLSYAAKAEVKDNFEKICLWAIKDHFARKIVGNEAAKNAVASMSDEKLLAYIRESKTYKNLVGKPENITRENIKVMITGTPEKNVYTDIRKPVNDMVQEKYDNIKKQNAAVKEAEKVADGAVKNEEIKEQIAEPILANDNVPTA